MIIHTEITFEQCAIEKNATDRTILKRQISAYWAGKAVKEAQLCSIQYLRLNNDRSIAVNKFGGERSDIGFLQFTEPSGNFLFNVFIEANGTHSGPNGSDVTLSGRERNQLNYIVKQWCEENRKHVARQVRWFAEKPWKHLEGLTPEQAIGKLTELGW